MLENAGLLEEDGSLLADKEDTQTKETKHSSGSRLDEAEVSHGFFLENGATFFSPE